MCVCVNAQWWCLGVVWGLFGWWRVGGLFGGVVWFMVVCFVVVCFVACVLGVVVCVVWSRPPPPFSSPSPLLPTLSS